MPVPRKKKSRARRNNRRSHQHLEHTVSQACPRCREAKQPHCVCPSCGFYKEAEVITMEKAK